MAELLLKIDAGSGYDDGDILCAFNERAILCCHAQHICHPWRNGLNSHGLRLANSVVEDFFLLTHEYKFAVISATEIRRTNLATLAEDILSDTPNAQGESIHVGEFVTRRMRSKAPDGGPQLAIFGERGSEYWFGGRIDFSAAKVNAVWNAIETRTANRRNQFTQWPLGQQDKKSHLAIPMNEFDDAESNNLVSSEIDGTDPDNPVTLRRRKHDVNWRSLLTQLQVNEADVRNKLLEVDPRGRPALNLATIVRRKPTAPRGPT